MLSTKVVTVSRSFPRNSYAISRVFRSTQRVPEATLKIFEKKFRYFHMYLGIFRVLLEEFRNKFLNWLQKLGNASEIK